VIGYDEVTKQMSSTDAEAKKRIFEEELRLTKDLLICDSKNYHAWQHRQWILSIFRDFSNEMEYINSLLHDDVRNNSAWNQRHFVIVSLGDFTSDNLLREVEETWTFIKVAPSNESPWSYLRGIINLSAVEYRIHFSQEVAIRCRELTRSDIRTVPHLALFIEALDDLIRHYTGVARERRRDGCGDAEGGLDTRMLYDEGITNLDLLISTIDPIRTGYWEYMKSKFVTAHANQIPNRRT